MSKIRMQKDGYTWYPYDPEDVEIHKSIPDGTVAEFTYHFSRNPGNHRRFFAFLKIAFECQEFFTNMENFRKWLIGKAGYYTIIQTPKGGTIFNPDSIAWDALDEPEFKKLFSDCIQAFIDTFGEKLPMDKLDDIVRF